MEVDEVADKVADLVLKILFRTKWYNLQDPVGENFSYTGRPCKTDEVADMMLDMEVNKVADMVMKILLQTE